MFFASRPRLKASLAIRPYIVRPEPAGQKNPLGHIERNFWPSPVPGAHSYPSGHICVNLLRGAQAYIWCRTEIANISFRT